jgi:hypothetical protein
MQDSLQVLHIALIWSKLEYASIANNNLTLADSSEHETTFKPKKCLYFPVVSGSLICLVFMT